MHKSTIPARHQMVMAALEDAGHAGLVYHARTQDEDAFVETASGAAVQFGGGRLNVVAARDGKYMMGPCRKTVAEVLADLAACASWWDAAASEGR